MWDEIYQRHYPELLRYAMGICHDEQLAQDVAQEVFLKALQNADTFEDLSASQRHGHWRYDQGSFWYGEGRAEYQSDQCRRLCAVT